MKQKRREWILILVVVGIIALVWYSGGLREHLTGVQTWPSDKASAQTLITTKLVPIATSLGYDAAVAWDTANIIDKYSTMYTAATSVPTKDQFVSQITSGQTTQYSQLTGEPKQMVDIAYQYFYGSSSTPSPAASPSTQPMTLSIPSPCKPQYTSIPGGSMEFKCYD